MTKTDNEKYVKPKADSMRWVAEGAFSTFRRVFGEHAMFLTWESIIQEIWPRWYCAASEGTNR